MKKSILVMGLAALLSLPLAVHGAEAPNHLYGNSGIVNMYDHMGSAVYMYKSSARMVAEDRDTGYIFSVDVKDISYNPEADRFQIQSVTPRTTIWFYCPLNKEFHGYSAMFAGDEEIDVPPYVNDQVSYVSYDQGKNWRPFYMDDTHGYNQPVHDLFWKGLNLMRGLDN